MYFMFILSIVSIIIQAVFMTLAIASGLYYLAELVEEYTVAAKHVIRWLIIAVASVHVCLILFEDIPFYLNMVGITQQILHGILIASFPSVCVTSVTFISAVALLLLHHYLAFSFFGYVHYGFSETLAYFTICQWLIPFALFVSLSANDYVLPTTNCERQPLLGDNNVVTDYLSRQSKRYSLLSFFSFAKESILPQRNKKAF